MLSASETEIHNDAIAGIAAINKLMKAKGYIHKTSRASASFETRYKKAGVGRYISLSGWHGTSKKYGEGKAILALYDCPDLSYAGIKTVVDRANNGLNFSSGELDAKLHKEGIDIILAYLKAL